MCVWGGHLNVKRLACAALSLLALGFVATPPAMAHDGSNTLRLGIANDEDTFSPFGVSDDNFNGFKVFLSSPRHDDSDSRGECTNPGRQENVNGRQWNWMAANGNYYDTVYDPSNHSRNLHGRGYKVHVSRNTKDNGYVANRTMSQNWGAQLHVVTHTNADGSTGCSSESANYFLAEWEHDGNAYDDRDLAQAFHDRMKDVAPGGQNIWRATNLAELETNAPRGDAYIELVFHTKPAAQS